MGSSVGVGVGVAEWVGLWEAQLSVFYSHRYNGWMDGFLLHPSPRTDSIPFHAPPPSPPPPKAPGPLFDLIPYPAQHRFDPLTPTPPPQAPDPSIDLITLPTPLYPPPIPPQAPGPRAGGRASQGGRGGAASLGRVHPMPQVARGVAGDRGEGGEGEVRVRQYLPVRRCGGDWIV